MPCDTPGIPESLHKNGRLLNQDFTSDNKLFIRVKPIHFTKTIVNGNPETKISIQAFTTDEQSSNRDSCSDAGDVLYNTNASNADDHFLNWGVISLGLAELINKVFNHPEVNMSFKSKG